jgi:hypothetical protein
MDAPSPDPSEAPSPPVELSTRQSLRQLALCATGASLLLALGFLTPWSVVGQGLDQGVHGFTRFIEAILVSVGALALSLRWFVPVLLVVFLSCFCFLIKTEGKKSVLDKPLVAACAASFVVLLLSMIAVTTNEDSTLRDILAEGPHAQAQAPIHALTDTQLKQYVEASAIIKTWPADYDRTVATFGKKAPASLAAHKQFSRAAFLVASPTSREQMFVYPRCVQLEQAYHAASPQDQARFKLTINGRVVSPQSKGSVCSRTRFNGATLRLASLASASK